MTVRVTRSKTGQSSGVGLWEDELIEAELSKHPTNFCHSRRCSLSWPPTPKRLLGKNRAMNWSDTQRTFLEQTHGAAMITLRTDGTPVAVRVGVALVDGQLWSSGTRGRQRTQTLRRDPRSTLFVFEGAGFRYLTIESRVTILDGPEAPQQSVRLFRTMQNRPAGPLMWQGVERSEPEFVQAMVDEQRLVYAFEPLRAYGL
jgi:PPOX class probable F420-dependent enzyme